MPSALMGKLGRTTRLPDDGRDFAETDVGASEADVPEEMIVKLHEVTSGAACLDHLPPVAEESDDAAKSGEK